MCLVGICVLLSNVVAGSACMRVYADILSTIRLEVGRSARGNNQVFAQGKKIILEQSIRLAEIDRRVAVTLRILPKTMNSLTVALVSRRLVVVTVAPYPSYLNNGWVLN